MMSFTFVLFLLLGVGMSCDVYAQDPFANAVVEEKQTALARPDSLPNGQVSVKDKDFDEYLQSQIKFSVPVMSIEQLKQIKDSRQKVYILDARSREEYEISHIEGARRVGFDDFSVEKVWNLDRNTKVVVYCGIGERSEKIAERLKQMGFKDVNNLYGSIIEWVNQGNTVVDKYGKPTKKVHIYDKNRLKWLKNGKGVF